jgi:hypothetical protein
VYTTVDHIRDLRQGGFLGRKIRVRGTDTSSERFKGASRRFLVSGAPLLTIRGENGAPYGGGTKQILSNGDTDNQGH